MKIVSRLVAAEREVCALRVENERLRARIAQLETQPRIVDMGRGKSVYVHKIVKGQEDETVI